MKTITQIKKHFCCDWHFGAALFRKIPLLQKEGVLDQQHLIRGVLKTALQRQRKGRCHLTIWIFGIYWTELLGPVFFNAEEHQVDLHIGIKEDDIEENDEEFLVKISPFERSITRRSKRSPLPLQQAIGRILARSKGGVPTKKPNLKLYLSFYGAIGEATMLCFFRFTVLFMKGKAPICFCFIRTVS